MNTTKDENTLFYAIGKELYIFFETDETRTVNIIENLFMAEMTQEYVTKSLKIPSLESTLIFKGISSAILTCKKGEKFPKKIEKIYEKLKVHEVVSNL